jgi:uncharacterized protein YjbI with pentapeptide repeats
MLSTAVIALAGIVLLVATVIPGIRLYWPQRRDPVSRTDLGVALMTGAFIAFAVLGLQLMIQLRSQFDANDRQNQADRQALLLLLGRSANLSGLDLHGKDLSGAYLDGKGLNGAKLQNANMEKAQLEHAQLVAAELQDAKMDYANLDLSNLRYANLAGASLVKAKLNGADLDNAVLSPEADGGRAVDLTKADLSNASARADFRYARLVNAKLVGARLAPANLQGADLSGAEMKFADLRGANLKDADLSRARDLQEAKDLSFAEFDRRTRWPNGFKWEYTKRDNEPAEFDPRTCARQSCFLPRTHKPVNDIAPELLPLRKKLGRTIAKRDCLPGWQVVVRPSDIEASAPGTRASFIISTQDREGLTARQFGTRMMEAFKKERQTIPSITVDGKRAFAERFIRAEKGVLPQLDVAVYFVTGRSAYILLASASPPLFPQFERDFVTLFRAIGTEGPLFPELRPDTVPCAT